MSYRSNLDHSLLLVCVALLAFAGCDTRAPVSFIGPNDQLTVLKTSLSYELPDDGSVQTNQFSVSSNASALLTPETIFFDQKGVRKSVALVNMVLGLQEALRRYIDGQDKAGAIALCNKVIELLQKEVDENGAESLLAEIALVEKLIENIGKDAKPVSVVDTDGRPGEIVNTASAPNAGAPVSGNSFDSASVGSSPGSSVSTPSAPSAPSGVSTDGKLGATPGGAQDIGLVRKWIESGQVPAPEHLTVQGLLSEHDLPLDGPACKNMLCIYGALAVTPVLDAKDSDNTFVQIGFSSGQDAATFKRKPINLVVVLDVSGSMKSSGKAEATKNALKTLIDKLGDDDRLGIVLFNSTAKVHLESTVVTDKNALKVAVDQIPIGGSTNIEAGLKLGFEMALAHRDAASGRSDRVFLMTDANPNVGKTGKESFIGLATEFAAKGVFLSSFGVGLDFKQELILQMSQLKGGNYFYLENAEKIQKVFDTDFDLMVTPVAFNMNIKFNPGPDYEIVDVYGVPDWDKKDGVAIQVKTLFLSRNKGAIVVRLRYTGSQVF